MIFLADFSPIKPEFGLFFWTLLFFLLFWGLIGKFAFKPINESLKKREGDIQDAIDLAKKTREEMNNMKSENERVLSEAREERARILAEAKERASTIVKNADEEANNERAMLFNHEKEKIH